MTTSPTIVLRKSRSPQTNSGRTIRRRARALVTIASAPIATCFSKSRISTRSKSLRITWILLHRFSSASPWVARAVTTTSSIPSRSVIFTVCRPSSRRPSTIAFFLNITRLAFTTSLRTPANSSCDRSVTRSAGCRSLIASACEIGKSRRFLLMCRRS